MTDRLDVLDLLKRRFPEGGTKHHIQRYLGHLARVALEMSDSENCPDGWTQCGDGSCVPDPIMCSGDEPGEESQP